MAIAAAIVLAGLVIGFSRRAPQNVATKVGAAGPTFRLKTLDGASLSSADLAGKPVVMNFWASWCSPCRQEAPLLEKTFLDVGDEVAFVGVDTNDTVAAARAFVDKFHITYPILLDPDGVLRRALEIRTGLPDTVFMDSRYRLVAANSERATRFGDNTGVAVLGALSRNVLDDAIVRLRAGPPPEGS